MTKAVTPEIRRRHVREELATVERSVKAVLGWSQTQDATALMLRADDRANCLAAIERLASAVRMLEVER